MCIKRNLNSFMIIAVFSFFLILGVSSKGYTAGPQPGPKEEGAPELVGKSVDGVLSVIVVEEDTIGADIVLGDEVSEIVVQHLVVTCKEAEIDLGPAVNQPSTGRVTFDQTVEECQAEGDLLCVEGMVFPTALDTFPALRDCFPWDDPTYTDLFITRVRNFIKTHSSIYAEVTLRLGKKQ